MTPPTAFLSTGKPIGHMETVRHPREKSLNICHSSNMGIKAANTVQYLTERR